MRTGLKGHSTLSSSAGGGGGGLSSGQQISAGNDVERGMGKYSGTPPSDSGMPVTRRPPVKWGAVVVRVATGDECEAEWYK